MRVDDFPKELYLLKLSDEDFLFPQLGERSEACLSDSGERKSSSPQSISKPASPTKEYTSPDGSPKTKGGRSVNPLPRHKRDSHINAEHRRRDKIKTKFEMLKTLVPSIAASCTSSSSKESKSAMLLQTVEYCQLLKAEYKHEQDEADALRQEISALRNEIQGHQSQLPAAGVSVDKPPSCSIDKLYEEYVKTRSKENSKFWIFSLIMKPLFDKYKENVSVKSFTEFQQTLQKWAENTMSLSNLRTVVVDKLSVVIKKTSLLTAPEKFSKEVSIIVDQSTARSNPASPSPSSPPSPLESISLPSPSISPSSRMSPSPSRSKRRNRAVKRSSSSVSPPLDTSSHQASVSSFSIVESQPSKVLPIQSTIVHMMPTNLPHSISLPHCRPMSHHIPKPEHSQKLISNDFSGMSSAVTEFNSIQNIPQGLSASSFSATGWHQPVEVSPMFTTSASMSQAMPALSNASHLQTYHRQQFVRDLSTGHNQSASIVTTAGMQSPYPCHLSTNLAASSGIHVSHPQDFHPQQTLSDPSIGYSQPGNVNSTVGIHSSHLSGILSSSAAGVTAPFSEDVMSTDELVNVLFPEDVMFITRETQSLMSNNTSKS